MAEDTQTPESRGASFDIGSSVPISRVRELMIEMWAGEKHTGGIENRADAILKERGYILPDAERAAMREKARAEAWLTDGDLGQP